MNTPRKSRDPRTLRPATRLVHGGALRSQFEETSEALFLTQGYLYDTMAEAEARFKGDAPGFIYSRFANPTVAMFEKRMALFEGADFVTPEQIQSLAVPVIAHRLMLEPQARFSGLTAEGVVGEIVKNLRVPA